MLLCSKYRRAQAIKDTPLASAATVEVVTDLCHHPQRLVTALEGGKYQRLVLGLCPGKYSPGEVQAQTRKAGLDPLGVEIVRLGRLEPARAGVLLAAAAARAVTFEGSGPEHAKPHLSPRLNGRALFKVNFESYLAVPAVDQSRCAADRGCNLCVRACPYGALTREPGGLHLAKVKCTSCGLCLTVCPTDALANPAFTPAQLEAQLTSLLLAPAGEPRGILFHCQTHPDPHLSPGWYPVRLPCVGMAPATWLLAPLLMGAGAVAVGPCGEDCPPGQPRQVKAKVAFCREFLGAIGASEDLVSVTSEPKAPPPSSKGKVEVADPFGLRAAGRVLSALAEAYGASGGVSLTHPAAPLGRVRLDLAACSRCGRCALACPCGALAYAEETGAHSLTFEAAACAACGLCLPVCPELTRRALSLTREVDLELLLQDRRVLFEDRSPACLACGRPIAPQGMLERVKEILGEDNAEVLEVLTNYCPQCRGEPTALYDNSPPEVAA